MADGPNGCSARPASTRNSLGKLRQPPHAAVRRQRAISLPGGHISIGQPPADVERIKGTQELSRRDAASAWPRRQRRLLRRRRSASRVERKVPPLRYQISGEPAASGSRFLRVADRMARRDRTPAGARNEHRNSSCAARQALRNLRIHRDLSARTSVTPNWHRALAMSCSRLMGWPFENAALTALHAQGAAPAPLAASWPDRGKNNALRDHSLHHRRSASMG